MKKFNLLLFSILLGGIFLLGTFPAVCAQETSEEEFTLEEITVTAQKTGAKDVQKISQSVSVISADDLRMNAPTNFADALSETAGIAFQSMFGQIYLRGVGSTTNEEDLSPGVQINTDGAPALTNLGGPPGGGGNQPTITQINNDVERIEILRGPSGSVNGRSAAAGTINIITKSPDFERVDGNVGITYGNYNTVQLNAALNIPMKLTGLNLPSYIENLSFRVAMAENKHSGYIVNENGEEVSGNQNSYNFRGKVKWQPIENLDLNGSFNYSRQAEDTNMSVSMLGGYPEEYAAISGRGVQEPHEDEPWVNAGRDEMSATRTASTQYGTSFDATYKTPWVNVYARFSHAWVPVYCTPDQQNCYEGKRGEKDYELRLNNLEDSWIVWNAGLAWTDRKPFTGPQSELGVMDPDFQASFNEWYGTGNVDQAYRDYFTHDYGGVVIDGTLYDLNDPTQPWNALTGRPDLVPGDTYYMTMEHAQRASQAYSGFANASIPLFEERHRLVLGLRKNFEKKKHAYSLGVYAPAATEAELDMVREQHLAAAAADPNYTYLEPQLNGGLPHWTFVPSAVSTTGEGEWRCDNCYLVDSDGPRDLVTDDEPVNYTLGWEYDLNQQVMLYAMIRNGYKPGGISQHAFPIRFYEPENMLAYSLGTKSRWFDQRLQLNLDVYLEDYDNYQQSLANENMFLYAEIEGKTYNMVGFSSGIVNFPRTYIYGFDFDYEWLITSKDRLSGNVAYLHADYADFVYEMGHSSDPWRPTTVDYSGRPMPYSPRWGAYMSYQHTFNFRNFYVAPRVTAQYKSKYYLHHELFWEIIHPEVWQPASTVFDAYTSIGPQDGTWNLNLYWKNFTEEPVRVLAIFTEIRLNDPMTYGMRFSMNF